MHGAVRNAAFLWPDSCPLRGPPAIFEVARQPGI